MIDFRYHLVSIVAVFLSLTVGLVLGTTMLQDPLLNTLQSETADLRGQSEDLRFERDEADRLTSGADQFVEAAAEDVLADRLRDVDVVVVAAPGADEDLVHVLGERVEDAGAKVTGRVLLEKALVDEAGSTFVDELALQVSGAPQDLIGGPYDKAGAELGGALAAREDDDASREGEEETGSREDSEDGASGDGDADDAAAVLAVFEEGGLITVQGSPARAADALLMIAPDGAVEESTEAHALALSKLAEALGRRVGPTVLAGGVETGREGGLIARVLAEETPVSTVDVAGRPTGDVVTVLALAEAWAGERGDYGVGDGASAFVPRPLPGPIEPSEEEEIDADAASGGRDEARRSASGGTE